MDDDMDDEKRQVFGVPRSELFCSKCGEPANGWKVIAYSYRKGNLLSNAPVSGVTGAIIAYYCKLHMQDANDSEVLEH